MVRLRGGFGALVTTCAALVACGSPAPVLSELDLELPMAVTCRPDSLTSLEVRALGDFPFDDAHLAVIDPNVPSTVSAFPPRTRVVTIDARGPAGWAGGGTFVPLDHDVRAPVLLLPYEQSCPLPDPDARLPEGGMSLALGDGGLWLGGGASSGTSLRRVVEVVPGEPVARMDEWPELFLGRSHAAASLLPDGSILVSGGMLSEGVVLDVYEVHERGEAVRQGSLASPRCRHAAFTLADGRVVLVGGSDASGALDHAEIVDVEQQTSARVPGGLSGARIAPSVLVLDDARVLVAGGVDDEGAPQPIVRWTGERFEPAATLEVRAEAAWVPLVGGRAAQIGGRAGSGWSSRVELVLDDESVVELGEGLLPALERPTAVALPTGEVLVVGRSGGNRQAYLLEPSAGTARELASTRAADRLVSLRDGSIAELDTVGLSLRRMSLRTAFDEPPVLALDAPARWTRQPSLQAEVDGARVDLAGSRYADVRVEIVLDGTGELLIVRESAAPLAIEISDRVRLGDCDVERAARVVVERRDGSLYLRAPSGDAHCEAALPERIGLAVRAQRGAILRELLVVRL